MPEVTADGIFYVDVRFQRPPADTSGSRMFQLQWHSAGSGPRRNQSAVLGRGPLAFRFRLFVRGFLCQRKPERARNP